VPDGRDTRNGLHLKGGVTMEEKIGYVSNFFGKISVAAVEITDGTVSVGETLHFKGHSTDFTSKVVSMEIEHEPVTEAKQGDSIGLKVSEKVRKKAKVYKIIEN
jgi:putative protease